jgi:hypothetical protein
MNNELIKTISNLTKNSPEAVRQSLVKLELGVSLNKLNNWKPMKKTAEDRDFEEAYRQHEERTHR